MKANLVTTSTDFSHLIAIVEGRIDEALSPEDTEALKAIMAELDPKINDAEFMAGQSPELQAKFKELADLRKRYNDKLKADDEAQKAIPAEMLKAVRGMGTDEAAVYAAIGKISDKASFDRMVQANPTLIAEVLDDFSGKDLKKAIAEFAKKGIKITVKQQAGFGALGGKKGIYEYDGKTYTTKKGAQQHQKAEMQEDKWEEINQAVMLVAQILPQVACYSPTGAPVTTSKDNNMTNKTNVTEASMNISMNGESAAEVKELIGILKNAGMPDVGPGRYTQDGRQTCNSNGST